MGVPSYLESSMTISRGYVRGLGTKCCGGAETRHILMAGYVDGGVYRVGLGCFV